MRSTAEQLIINGLAHWNDTASPLRENTVLCSAFCAWALYRLTYKWQQQLKIWAYLHQHTLQKQINKIFNFLYR